MQVSWKVNEKLNLSFSQRFAGQRMEPQFMSDPVMMKAFQLTDISAQYKLFGKWVIYGSVRNLFDEQYQEVLGFGTRGRNYVIGIRN